MVEDDDDAASVVVDFWKRFCGGACSGIYRAAVEVRDQAAAGVAAVGLVEAVSEAGAVVVLAAVLVVETVLEEAARAAVGSPAQTIWQPGLRYENHCANS